MFSHQFYITSTDPFKFFVPLPRRIFHVDIDNSVVTLDFFFILFTQVLVIWSLCLCV